LVQVWDSEVEISYEFDQVLPPARREVSPRLTSALTQPLVLDPAEENPRPPGLLRGFRFPLGGDGEQVFAAAPDSPARQNVK